jgi:hypothetical protein
LRQQINGILSGVEGSGINFPSAGGSLHKKEPLTIIQF